MAIAYGNRRLTTRTEQEDPVTGNPAIELSSFLRSHHLSCVVSHDEPANAACHIENLQEPIAPAISLALDVIGGESCSVFVAVHGCTSQLVELRGLGNAEIEQHYIDQKFPGAPRWVIDTGQPLTINTFEELPWPLCATRYPFKRLLCVPLSARGQTLGAMLLLRDLGNPLFEEHELHTLQSIGTMAAIALENIQLHDTIVEGYSGTIKALAGAIDAKDPYTCGHSQRVAAHALMAGNALGLDQEALQTLEYAAMLHDIGKIGIDDTILRKPEQLTPQERACIQDHPVIGAAITGGIPFLKDTASLILYHHERYDGKGYPHSLSGSEIPLGARLICVADAFDTMTTDRPYRRAMTIKEAMTEMRMCSGTQFCPTAIDAFMAGLSYRFHENAY